MKKLQLFIGSILATFAIMAGLGMLASLKELEQDKGYDLPVFTSQQTVKGLSEELLVDQLEAAKHSFPLSRAHYSSNGSLSLDIKVAASIMTPSLLYEELYHWLNFSFVEMNNVDRLQLRIVVDDRKAHKKQILLGLDARKDQVAEAHLQELKAASSELSKTTEQALRLTYTSMWHKKFAPAGQ